MCISFLYFPAAKPEQVLPVCADVYQQSVYQAEQVSPAEAEKNSNVRCFRILFSTLALVSSLVLFITTVVILAKHCAENSDEV